MKLARYLSLAGVTSRRKAEELIRQGVVSVNGEVVNRPEERVSPSDRVRVREKRVEIPGEYVYLLLNKPAGVITTMEDPQGRPTVSDLVKGVKARVYPVGRLDKDTTGVLLLTNDGELSFKLQHPRYGVAKTYRAGVKGVLSSAALQKLREGIRLEEGRTAPAEVKLIKADERSTEALLEITLRQGWKRQVKRMCRAAGMKVLWLQRVRFAFLGLEGVPRGAYRHLTPGEVRRLKELVMV